MRITILFLLLIIGLSRAEAQVRYDDIHCPYFKKVYKAYIAQANYNLPFFLDKRMDFSYMRKNKIRPVAYHYIDKESLFYVNIDKSNKQVNSDETQITYVFFDTNGDYILAVISNMSDDHLVSKFWLVTFDLWGKMIDFIPINICYSYDIQPLEGEISKDMKVDVYELDFPDNERIYDVENSKPFNNLRGQRIDRHYQITTEGKFNLLRTVRYEPQIYTPEMLMDKTCIFQRNEKPLE